MPYGLQLLKIVKRSLFLRIKGANKGLHSKDNIGLSTHYQKVSHSNGQITNNVLYRLYLPILYRHIPFMKTIIKIRCNINYMKNSKKHPSGGLPKKTLKCIASQPLC